MPMTDQSPWRGDLLADGVTASFPYTFRILTKNDLTVLVNGSLQAVDNQYAVAGIGEANGGTITFVALPASGDRITILPNQPFSQLSQYSPNEAFPAPRVEKDFDKVVRLCQQLKEMLSRSLRLLVTEAGTEANTTWPAVADRPNKFLGFNDAGDPIATLGPEADAAAISAAAAAASADSAAISATQLIAHATDTVAITVGSRPFTIPTGKQFPAGTWLLIASDADPTNYMHGQVTSYVDNDLVVNVTDIGGSGTYADWTITLSGTQGPIGPEGPAFTLADGSVTTAKLNDSVFAGLDVVASDVADYVALVDTSDFGVKSRALLGTLTGTLTQGTIMEYNPITPGATGSAGHGLGVVPNFLTCGIQCLSADAGFSVGKIIFMPGSAYYGSAGRGYDTSADAVNVEVVVGTDAQFVFMHPSSFSSVSIDPSKWKFFIVPWRVNP